jgi:hypothetical protein
VFELVVAAGSLPWSPGFIRRFHKCRNSAPNLALSSVGLSYLLLGIVLKKRDIADGVKLGLDITQESDSRKFDAHRALEGKKPPKRRLILDPTRAGTS